MGEARRRRATGENSDPVGVELTVIARTWDDPKVISIPASAVKTILANPMDMSGITMGEIVEMLKGNPSDNRVVAMILDYHFQKCRGSIGQKVITEIKQALQEGARVYLYVLDDAGISVAIHKKKVTDPLADAVLCRCQQHVKANTLKSYITSPNFLDEHPKMR